MGEGSRQVECWLASPSLSLISETLERWSRLAELLVAGHVEGPMVHDARVAAICLQHGGRTLLTADRDFGRSPALRVDNPLTARGARR